MDFLKKLNINDSSDNDAKPTPGSAVLAAHPNAPAPSSDHHRDGQQQQQHVHHTGSLFDKISEAMGDHAAAAPAPHVPAAAPPPPEHKSVFDKIGDALQGGHQAAPPVPPPVRAAPEEHNLLDKISGAFGGSQHHPTPAPVPPREIPGEPHLFDKISNIIGGGPSHHAEPPAPPPPPVPESLVDRISEALGGHGGHQAQQQQKVNRDEGVLGRIGEALGHGKAEEPPKPQSIGDKINSMLGGGQKAEAKEDTLDKTIDFVQEHVLKKGQQKDETVLEQLKDKQIADAIRHGIKNVTGKELPERRDDRS